MCQQTTKRNVEEFLDKLISSLTQVPVTADPYDPWIAHSLPEHVDHLVERWQRNRDVVFEDVALSHDRLANSFSDRPYVLNKEEGERNHVAVTEWA